MYNNIDKQAKIIWDYHHVNHKLEKGDCIFVLGSHDGRVAEYAAKLFLDGYAPYIVFSGGFGHLTEGVFKKPEADTFAEIAIKSRFFAETSGLQDVRPFEKLQGSWRSSLTAF
jgi:hypothetical protein